ncbi:unnamed protein product [Bursaphelenchus xylophilus]|uniref:RNA helicase n=1 Tax=Bursaphelenchus xylophilus TaxID=6326 RepID=A0A1I7RY08_BURXY|nr:unnamed protein product [Bursaphelenchus xylophilus]CAG9085162.1 unnamed protein product [Bursaphelenchus xylophilus]
MNRDLYQTLSFGTAKSRKRKQLVSEDLVGPLSAIAYKECDKPVSKKKKKNIFEDELTATELFLKTRRVDDAREITVTAKYDGAQKIRKANKIFVWGEDIPHPMIDFNELRLPKEIMENLKAFNINVPTPAQMQVIPLLFEKRDLLVSAPTGSGKTMAFLLPIAKQALDVGVKKDELFSIFVAPTAVLAEQIFENVTQLIKGLPLKAVLVTSEKKPGLGNFVVCTPSKFINCVKHGLIKKDALENTEWLVVDEADRLFDTTEGKRNFRIQLGEIFKMTDSPQTRRAFFSATFSAVVERWCKDNLMDVATVCVGPRNTSNSDVVQELKFSGDEHGKMFLVEDILREGFDPPALIFVQSKERAGELFVQLQKGFPHIPMRLMSSELTTEARTKILEQLKSGEVFVLICTEMMGRGIDIPEISLVINFDLPTSVASYIHRIGRTGRAGRNGKAITFFSYGDIKVLPPIASIVKQAGYDVPEYIFEMKVNRDLRKSLKSKAPNREVLGSVKKWKKVKKDAIKKKIMTGKPKFIMKKGQKTKAKSGDQKPKAKNQKKD